MLYTHPVYMCFWKLMYIQSQVMPRSSPGPEVTTCGANKKGALILGRASAKQITPGPIVWLVTEIILIIPASNSTHLETKNQPFMSWRNEKWKHETGVNGEWWTPVSVNPPWQLSKNPSISKATQMAISTRNTFQPSTSLHFAPIWSTSPGSKLSFPPCRWQ